MNFAHFQQLVQELTQKAAADTPAGFPVAPELPPERLPPLVLAYIGDAYFSMYVRMRLLSYEHNKVRILHTFGAKMVSAVMQAKAARSLEAKFTEPEAQIFRRGRNAKSTVPKSASVSEYRYSTAFEALLGYLYLKNETGRLEDLAAEAFTIILNEIKGD